MLDREGAGEKKKNTWALDEVPQWPLFNDHHDARAMKNSSWWFHNPGNRGKGSDQRD